MKMEQYDTIRLTDGRMGVVVEILGAGEELLVDVGSSPEDWETISVTQQDVEAVLKD